MDWKDRRRSGVCWTELDTGYINPVAVGDKVTVAEDGAGAWAIGGRPAEEDHPGSPGPVPCPASAGHRRKRGPASNSLVVAGT